MNANRNLIFKRAISLGLLTILFLNACAPPDGNQDNFTLPPPVTIANNIEADQPLSEAPSSTAASLPAATAAPSLTPAKDDPPAVTPTLASTATEMAPALALPQESSVEFYRVAFVADNDRLNVRSGPGVENEISGTFAPDESDILISGPGQQVAGSNWVPVTGNGVQGWVNDRYLTGQVLSAAFCQDTAVLSLLEQLQTAVANEDGDLLAELVDPQRGLRLHTSWWNPEVHVQQEDVSGLFSSTTVHDWGIEDGSGLPISGSFGEVMLPLLQDNLLTASSKTCNQIEHGPTAGLVRLPDGYQNVNSYSYYRPATDTIGFDWGTWVIGIEFWQSEPVLSYLVFYAYEI